MVKKLLKHEIIAYLRGMLPIYIVLLGVAVLGRIVQLFENQTTAYEIISGSTIFVYVVAIFVAIVLTFVFGVQRFYKNLFTGEGYLSFTLPVTPSQHIFVKMLTAVLFEIATIVVIAVSLAAFTMGDVLVEIGKALAYLWNIAYREVGWHLPLYVLEILLLIIVASATGYLLYYACITLGQTAKKNRVGSAVGVYFIHYFIVQALGTVFSIAASEIDWSFLDGVFQWISDHEYATIHIGLCGSVVLYALIGLLYFIISKAIIRRKLNLE